MASIQQMIKPEFTDSSNVHRMFGSGEIAIFQQRTIIMPEVEKMFYFLSTRQKNRKFSATFKKFQLNFNGT